MNDFPQMRHQCCAMRGIQAGTFTLRFVESERIITKHQFRTKIKTSCYLLEPVFVLFYNLESQFFPAPYLDRTMASTTRFARGITNRKIVCCLWILFLIYFRFCGCFFRLAKDTLFSAVQSTLANMPGSQLFSTDPAKR